MQRVSFLQTITLITSILYSGWIIGQVNPSSQISDTPTSIIGFNHIGISVHNLEEMLPFYQNATGFEVIKREKISQSSNADVLFDIEGISFETATLKGPNMLLELTQYSNQMDAVPRKMLPQGPGMTHTCYQSPDWESGYDKFKNNGADILSRGDQPIDLGGYGVTYAYAYDPDGNMIELEQIARHRITHDSSWLQSNPMWMTQVALISPDLDRLVEFYQTTLSILPYRSGHYSDLPRLDDVIDHDNTDIRITWFRMDGLGKMLELMQYTHPETPKKTFQKHPTVLGYSFSLEVDDIQQEYHRLKQSGVQFLSEPRILGEFWMVFANDVDGNVFSLRQPTSAQSIYSITNMLSETEE